MNMEITDQTTDGVAPESQHDSQQWAKFGRAAFMLIAEAYADGGDEWTHEMVELAEKFGITRREPYSIERHGEAMQEYCEPGDVIWSWAHLPNDWKLKESDK